MTSSNNSVLHFTFECESEESFKVTRFAFDEGLSTPFSGVIDLASGNSRIRAETMVDKIATLKVFRNGALVRIFSGIVRAFTVSDTGSDFTFYQAIIVPSLARLAFRQNSRIFQNKSVINIVETILSEMNITDYALALRNKHEAREYCVQYRENDLEFIERLLAEEGISYYCEHQEGKHTIVFADQSSVLDVLEGSYPYNVRSGGNAPVPYVRQFSMKSQIASSQAVLKDYSFKSPSFDFLNNAMGQSMDYQGQNYEHFDYPGRYKNQDVGRDFTKTRIHYLRRDSLTAVGLSDLADIVSGFKLPLSGHPEESFNQEWLVTHVRHEGEQPQSLEHQGIDGMTRYSNEFACIPGKLQWKPTPNPKPKMDGLQVAVVVGAKNEEIYCDEFGRVKVQFPWDREGKGNESSSCWIRASDGWAGASMGMIALPRVGHEVLVDFITGDVDQPIITGRTYHATHRQPYKLPEHKTITGIKTKTHKGEGYNELYFDDENEKQLINVHAQKNMNIKVLNVKNERVDFDRIQSIGNDESLVVANDRTITVEGEQHHKTTGAFKEQIDGDSSLSIDGDFAQKIKGAIGINADGDITLKSKNKITLQVGGSFIVIDPAQIDLNAGVVNINVGGSPGQLVAPENPKLLDALRGKGSGFLPSCPLQAKALEEATGGGGDEEAEEEMGWYESPTGKNGPLDCTGGFDPTSGLDTSWGGIAGGIMGSVGQMMGGSLGGMIADLGGKVPSLIPQIQNIIGAARSMEDNPLGGVSALAGFINMTGDGEGSAMIGAIQDVATQAQEAYQAYDRFKDNPETFADLLNVGGALVIEGNGLSDMIGMAEKGDVMDVINQSNKNR